MTYPDGEAAAAQLAEQERLRAELELDVAGPVDADLIAGLDVAYAGDERLAAAVVVLDAASHRVVDRAVVLGRASFGYVPGLFAFREVPPLMAALDKLRVVPDVLICDGHGIAHPRGFGLACHLGVLTGRPAFGVGKTALVGTWEPPGTGRGAASPLLLGTQTVGAVLRTQDGVKPVFVSVGHRIRLDQATALVLSLSPRYRLPETTRAADRLCRESLKGMLA